MTTLAYAYGIGTGTNLGELGKGTAVLVIGADPEEEAPVYLLRLRGIMRRGGDIIVANGRPTKLGADATHDVRYRTATKNCSCSACYAPSWTPAEEQPRLGRRLRAWP